MDYRDVRPITPKQAWEKLKNKGVDISLEETEEVLKFLRMLARIAVEQHLRGATAKDLGVPHATSANLIS